MPYFRRNTVDLFTADEHAVLANWLGVRPPKVAKGIEPDEAIARMGFKTEPHHYRLVAHSPSRVSLPRKGRRVGLRIVLFEMLSVHSHCGLHTRAVTTS